MARSAYVYVVMDSWDSLPVAAFTVKHELITWMRGKKTRFLKAYSVRDSDMKVTEMNLDG